MSSSEPTSIRFRAEQERTFHLLSSPPAAVRALLRDLEEAGVLAEPAVVSEYANRGGPTSTLHVLLDTCKGDRYTRIMLEHAPAVLEESLADISQVWAVVLLGALSHSRSATAVPFLLSIWDLDPAPKEGLLTCAAQSVESCANRACHAAIVEHCARHGGHSLYFIILWLWRCRVPGLFDVLVSKLGDGGLLAAAAYSLGKLGDRRAIPFLESVRVEDVSNVFNPALARHEVSKALQKLRAAKDDPPKPNKRRYPR